MYAKMKVSKNVTLKFENIEVIKQVMERYNKNFSVSLNVIIEDWVKIRQVLNQDTPKPEVKQ